jgi:Domain of unknown function (DUF1877)
MSMIGWLRHISANGIQRTKENHKFLREVIFSISPVNTESPLILDISELTSYQISILREITSDIYSVCNRWTERDIENIEYLKENNAEIYEYLKPDLFSIVTDEKDCFYLELGTAWDMITHLLTCGISMEENLCVISTENLYSINIFHGKQFYPNDSPYSKLRYQEVDEVLEISRALLTITESEIRQRFDKALQTKPRVYRPYWVEGSYPAILEHCQEVKAFYKAAAINGFGIFSDID